MERDYADGGGGHVGGDDGGGGDGDDAQGPALQELVGQRLRRLCSLWCQMRRG